MDANDLTRRLLAAEESKDAEDPGKSEAESKYRIVSQSNDISSNLVFELILHQKKQSFEPV